MLYPRPREMSGLPVSSLNARHQTPKSLQNEGMVGQQMTRFDCLPGVYHGSDVFVAASRVQGPTLVYDSKGRLVGQNIL